MNDTNAETALDAAAMRTLSAIADAVIPPSDAYGVPGAGDPAIAAGMVEDAGGDPGRLLGALQALDEMAAATVDGAAFADLEGEALASVVAAFRAERKGEANMIANLATQAYYRDDRVMTALGLEPRPPFPVGYEIRQGDWSLLDPVRRRPRLYRETE